MKVSEKVTKIMLVMGVIDILVTFSTTIAGLIAIFAGSGVALNVTVTLSVISSAMKICQFHFGRTSSDDDIDFTF